MKKTFVVKLRFETEAEAHRFLVRETDADDTAFTADDAVVEEWDR